ncbi:MULTISPECIES: serine aminopeptidase domain-containing protein [Enterococcus]|uniref:Alpha/beta hydrolase n=1 Tax=Enterococcus alishanensis TaxID=1303817 RepID=A0ABS6TD67_9ENTE|nr:alpha/beta hydrolase [Enterococcus alishanensis]MBV7390842.1 alpha/beta hydrolase [Enterococcus alishanensis]
MKNHFFKNFAFEFETTRLMWYIPNGGADYGEVATVAEKINPRNNESWYQEWSNFAEKLQQRGQQFHSTESCGNAYLRASRYYQAAEFFLSPQDPRKLTAYQQSVSLFYQALDLKKISYQRYQVGKFRTVFFQTTKESRGTFYICGGFDALLEELYFTNVVSTLAQGFDVVLYEGPGQSNVIREHQLVFDENWDQVAEVVINFYEKEIGLKGLRIGVGISLGGLLLARAASSNQNLFDKVILYNYFPSMLASFQKSLPKFLHKYLDTGFPLFLEKICSQYIASNSFLNWQVTHAKWVFGADSLNELLKVTSRFNEEIAYKRLTTDCLIFLAKNENYYDYQLGRNFYQKIPAKNKRLILFDKQDFSADLHCQNGAAYDSNDQLFQWLDEETLKS